MTLVMLAMGRRWSGFFAYRTWPVCKSCRIADGDVSFGGMEARIGVCRAVGNGEGEPLGGTGVGGGVAARPAAGTAAARAANQRERAPAIRIFGAPEDRAVPDRIATAIRS
jgi:hypothetical protein